MVKTMIGNVNIDKNSKQDSDLNEALLQELIELSRVPAVSRAVQEILTMEAVEFEPNWVHKDGTRLSELDRLCLPPWERIGYTRIREECKNPEEEE
jgi:hypothetical protein